MDPASAIGVASAVLSFVDFTYKVVRGAVHIYSDASTLNQEWHGPEDVACKMHSLARLLRPPTSTSQCLTRDETDMIELAGACEILAKQLASKFGSLKPKNASSRRQCLWAAIKAHFKSSEIEDLETRLADCRSQLQLHLIHSDYLCGRDMTDALELIRQTQRDDIRLVRSLHQSVQEMKGTIDQVAHAVTYDPSVNERALSQLEKAIAMQEGSFDAMTESRILESLTFPGMNDRYDMIHEAHMDTFEWMHEEGAALTKAQKRAKELFGEWLSSGNGIIHISGKHGSGKSTLMKFLVDHSKTRKHLEEWAGDRKLVLASFFFWRPGTPEQKSMSGLYRSLLRGCLHEVTSLIRHILPDVWEMARSRPWQTYVSISDKQIRGALSRLVKNQDLHVQHRFCFFIDGLDEYEENSREDHRDMINHLCEWAASTRAKICVSSREYNIFMNAFDETRRIRLHHLTEHDMTTYVSDRLKCVLDDDIRSSLVGDIVTKAQGIFLWVTLVVREIRHQMENGVSPQGLSVFLQYVPEELEDLYLHILHKLLRPHERLMAYRTFALMSALGKATRLLLWQFSFLEEYIANPNFAIEKSRRSELEASRRDAARLGEPWYTEPWQGEAWHQRHDRAAKQLNAWCRGLVEADIADLADPVGHQSKQTDHTSLLTYTHRSVAEFVSSARMQEETSKAVAHFSVVGALSQMVLARLYCFERSKADLLWLDQFTLITKLRLEERLQEDLEAPYGTLRALDDINSPWAARLFTKIEGPSSWRVDPLWESPGYRPKLGDLTSALCLQEYSGRSDILAYPGLRLQLLRHDHPYPLWKLKHDTSLVLQDQAVTVIIYACLLNLLGRFWEQDGDGYIPDYSILETLCGHPHHSPNITSRVALWSEGNWERHLKFSKGLSIWQHFLIRWTFTEVVLPWVLEDHFAGKRVCRDTSYWGMKGHRGARKEEWLAHCGRIFELFLQATGLDPFFRVWVQYRMRSGQGRFGKGVAVESRYSCGFAMIEARHERAIHAKGLERYPDEATRSEDDGKELTRENSKSWDLQRLIEEVGFPNKDALFRLIGQRESEIGDVVRELPSVR